MEPLFAFFLVLLPVADHRIHDGMECPAAGLG